MELVDDNKMLKKLLNIQLRITTQKIEIAREFRDELLNSEDVGTMRIFNERLAELHAEVEIIKLELYEIEDLELIARRGY